jgi:hypothetical protein
VFTARYGLGLELRFVFKGLIKNTVKHSHNFKQNTIFKTCYVPNGPSADYVRKYISSPNHVAVSK